MLYWHLAMAEGMHIVYSSLSELLSISLVMSSIFSFNISFL